MRFFILPLVIWGKEIKGSVSRKLRPRMLFFIRKLFINPFSVNHFHKVFLKGYAAIYV